MSPDPAATNALQERLGGQFDEMRTSHVELIGTTISRLLDGSPGYKQEDRPGRQAGREVATPLKITLDTSNIHHYLVGSGRPPGRRCRQPWSRSYVYNSGNLGRCGPWRAEGW